MAELHINLDNLDFYEVDVDNPPFNESDHTEEELKAIEEHNDKFMETDLNKTLIPMCNPCNCRMGEIMDRTMRRAQLLGQRPGPNIQINLEQEDVDAYKFGIVVTMEGGRYKSIDCIVKECKKCHHIEINGNSSVITRLLAESFTHFVDNQEAEQERMDQAFTMADLEEDGYVATDLDEEPEDTNLVAMPVDKEPTNKIIDLQDGIAVTDDVKTDE